MALGATPIVEIAFGCAPNDPNPLWTNVTPWIRRSDNITITRGRGAELDRPTAGSITFTLDNLGRRFDPTNTAGPYYQGGAGLAPRVPIRVRATYNSVTYPVFKGRLIGGWQVSWTGADSVVYIEGTDSLGALFDEVPPPTALDKVRSTDTTYRTLRAVWPMETDPPVEKVTGTVALTNDSTPEAAGNPVVVGSTASRKYSRGQYHYTRNYDCMVSENHASSVPYQRAYDDSMELWFRMLDPLPIPTASLQSNWDSTGISYQAPVVMLYQELGPSGFPIFGLGIATRYESNAYVPVHTYVLAIEGDPVGGTSKGLHYELVNTVWDWDGPFQYQRLDDGNVHHLVYAMGEGDGALPKLYIDGAATTYQTAKFWTNYGPAGTAKRQEEARLGNMPLIRDQYTSYDFWHPYVDVELSDVAIYRGKMSQTEVIELYDAGKKARAPELVSDRMRWLMDCAGILKGTNFASTITDTYPYVQTGDTGSLLSMLEQTEQGMLFVDREGAMVMRPRNWAWEGTDTRCYTVQGTFSDTDASKLPYSDTETLFTLDDIDLITECSVTRQDGLPQEAKAASMPYGKGRLELTGLQLPNESASRSIAEWQVYANSTAKVRVKRLSYACEAKAADLFPFTLSVEPGWLVTVKRTPPGGGAELSIDAHVWGIQHTIGDTWEVSLLVDDTRAGKSWFKWGVSTWDNTNSEGWSY